MLLGYEVEKLKDIKGYITAKEIAQQPRLWRETVEIFKENFEDIKNYVDKIKDKENLRVIFTGAGTSAFVGECVVPYLFKKSQGRIEAVATTDIVAYPEYYLQKDVPTLLISCARSGNSPESVAAVSLAEQLVSELYQIALTCNREGKLAKKMKESDNNLLVMMPEDSDDQGFAMTGSCTTMMLSSILLYNLENFEDAERQVEKMAKFGEDILANNEKVLKSLAQSGFERIVYLGAGTFSGLSRESSLKILELTAGKIAAVYDTPLGFRHGPKSIVNDKTLIVMYLSKNSHARKYEIDLLKEMYSEEGNKKIVVVASEEYPEAKQNCDYYLCGSSVESKEIDNVYLMFPYLLNAQMLAIFASINFEISPDNPCPSGSVNRVVKGVIIHDYK